MPRNWAARRWSCATAAQASGEEEEADAATGGEEDVSTPLTDAGGAGRGVGGSMSVCEKRSSPAVRVNAVNLSPASPAERGERTNDGLNPLHHLALRFFSTVDPLSFLLTMQRKPDRHQAMQDEHDALKRRGVRCIHRSLLLFHDARAEADELADEEGDEGE